jgi:hypothetical protein
MKKSIRELEDNFHFIIPPSSSIRYKASIDEERKEYLLEWTNESGVEMSVYYSVKLLLSCIKDGTFVKVQP